MPHHPEQMVDPLLQGLTGWRALAMAARQGHSAHIAPCWAMASGVASETPLNLSSPNALNILSLGGFAALSWAWPTLITFD